MIFTKRLTDWGNTRVRKTIRMGVTILTGMLPKVSQIANFKQFLRAFALLAGMYATGLVNEWFQPWSITDDRHLLDSYDKWQISARGLWMLNIPRATKMSSEPEGFASFQAKQNPLDFDGLGVEAGARQKRFQTRIFRAHLADKTLAVDTNECADIECRIAEACHAKINYPSDFSSIEQDVIRGQVAVNQGGNVVESFRISEDAVEHALCPLYLVF